MLTLDDYGCSRVCSDAFKDGFLNLLTLKLFAFWGVVSNIAGACIFERNVFNRVAIIYTHITFCYG